MSSVLNALKKQSSPLLQTPHPVALESAPARGGSGRWWLLALVLIGALIIGVLGGRLISQSEPQQRMPEVVQPVAATQAAHYSLGTIVPIRQPMWPNPVAETPAVEGVEIVSQARTQASESIVSDNQAIDLNQISPELLNAFDAALSEQSGQSVIPKLAELSLSFQRTIPSFSYDGHQYSSREEARWVVLNGIRLHEGETLQGLRVLAIGPSHVVLAKDAQAFQQSALDDWTRP